MVRDSMPHFLPNVTNQFACSRKIVRDVPAGVQTSALLIDDRPGRVQARQTPVANRRYSARPTGVDQEARAVIQQTGRIFLIITLAAKATAAATPRTTATPMAAAAESRALGPGFIHGEGPPLQGLSVKSLDRPLHVFFIGKLDEAKPSRFACHLVANDRGRNNLKPSVDHKFAEYTIGYTAGKVPHE